MKSFSISIVFLLNIYIWNCFSSEALKAQSLQLNESTYDSLFRIGETQKLINRYTSVNELMKLDSFQLVNLMELYSIQNREDSSLACMKYLLQKYPDYKGLDDLKERNFYSLTYNEHWLTYFDQVFKNYISAYLLDSSCNLVFMKYLNLLRIRDNSYYYHVHLSESKHGRESPLTKAIWQFKESISKQNIRILDSLINKYGWPEKSLVASARVIPFLLVQHADLATQKRYLPQFEYQWSQGKIPFNWIAMLTDRILLRERKPQKYGSQSVWNPHLQKYVLYYVENPDSMNILRMEMGIGSPISQEKIDQMYNPN